MKPTTLAAVRSLAAVFTLLACAALAGAAQFPGRVRSEDVPEDMRRDCPLCDYESLSLTAVKGAKSMKFSNVHLYFPKGMGGFSGPDLQEALNAVVGEASFDPTTKNFAEQCMVFQSILRRRQSEKFEAFSPSCRLNRNLHPLQCIVSEPNQYDGYHPGRPLKETAQLDSAARAIEAVLNGQSCSPDGVQEPARNDYMYFCHEQSRQAYEAVQRGCSDAVMSLAMIFIPDHDCRTCTAASEGPRRSGRKTGKRRH
jgi:hypothetical protein